MTSVARHRHLPFIPLIPLILVALSSALVLGCSQDGPRPEPPAGSPGPEEVPPPSRPPTRSGVDAAKGSVPAAPIMDAAVEPAPRDTGFAPELDAPASTADASADVSGAIPDSSGAPTDAAASGLPSCGSAGPCGAGMACQSATGTAPRCVPCTAGQPCLLYAVDLTKGKGEPGLVWGKAGRFDAGGWSCTRWDDQLRWYFPGAKGVTEGYLEMEVTNWDPLGQPMAPGAPRPFNPPRNQFLNVGESCPGAARGYSWQLRQGGGYNGNVKLEVLAGGKAFEDGSALDGIAWNTSTVYKVRFSWDPRSFTVSIGNKRYTMQTSHQALSAHPTKMPSGICRMNLGETYPSKAADNPGTDSMGCLQGPRFRSIRIVSLSGPPTGGELGDPNAYIPKPWPGASPGLFPASAP
jgi:hypothetical protein